jgi:hypothetical protein
MQTSVDRWEGRTHAAGELLEPADIASMIVALVMLPDRAEVTDLHIRPAFPPRSAG